MSFWKEIDHYTEKIYVSGGCVTLSIGEQPTIDTVCKSMKEDQQLVTLFSENFVPLNCRSSIEGVWQFAYQVRNNYTYK